MNEEEKTIHAKVIPDDKFEANYNENYSILAKGDINDMIIDYVSRDYTLQEMIQSVYTAGYITGYSHGKDESDCIS